jgi:hypothetical protein
VDALALIHPTFCLNLLFFLIEIELQVSKIPAHPFFFGARGIECCYPFVNRLLSGADNFSRWSMTTGFIAGFWQTGGRASRQNSSRSF